MFTKQMKHNLRNFNYSFLNLRGFTRITTFPDLIPMLAIQNTKLGASMIIDSQRPNEVRSGLKVPCYQIDVITGEKFVPNPIQGEVVDEIVKTVNLIIKMDKIHGYKDLKAFDIHKANKWGGYKVTGNIYTFQFENDKFISIEAPSDDLSVLDSFVLAILDRQPLSEVVRDNVSYADNLKMKYPNGFALLCDGDNSVI